MVALLAFCGCSSTRENKSFSEAPSVNFDQKNRIIEVVKISLCTWDHESGVVFGDDSALVLGKINNRFDSMTIKPRVLSKDASTYIIDFIKNNMKDSVKGGLKSRQYFIAVSLYGSKGNEEFNLQRKTDNNFLGRLIDTLNVSKYQKECEPVISILLEYDRINKSLN